MLRVPAIAVGLAILSAAGVAGAAEHLRTDANIVTGLDISDSVSAADRRQQIVAMASALRSPELMAAIRRGEAGQVGFAVFVWHHHRFGVVPWTVVAGADDAEAVARALEARIPVNVDDEVRGKDTFGIGRLTDLSRAIDHAGALLAAAPFETRRGVVNIVGNGPDNMGEPAAAARDRLVAAGATLNGVALNAEAEVADYFGAEVAGGPGAFVLAADGAEPIGEVMRRKFLQDLMAAAE